MVVDLGFISRNNSPEKSISFCFKSFQTFQACIHTSFFQFCSQLPLHPTCRHFMKLQNIMDDMVCWSMAYIQMCGYFIHCYTAIFFNDGFNYCNGLWRQYSVYLTRSRRVCYRNNAVHELPSPLVHWLQWQTCITLLNFLCRWISLGLIPSLLNNGWQNAVILWCMFQAVPPYLHNYCAVVLHSCILLPPVSHSSNNNYHCCQLTRQSGFRNFIALLKFSFDFPSNLLVYICANIT